MAKSYNKNGAFSDVEAMVRAAGCYVQASDQLRPRVLEAVRVQDREQRAQRWILCAAMLMLPLAVLAASVRHEFADGRPRPNGILVAAGFDEFFAPTAAAADNRTGDGDWRMSDAFTELRHQQAEVLRPGK